MATRAAPPHTAGSQKMGIRINICVGEYTFLGRECKSTGIGKIEAEVFMSQEEIFIPRSDSWLFSRGWTLV